ncbi:ABC transporter permease [Candidatus Hodarchaeum mangrovi]
MVHIYLKNLKKSYLMGLIPPLFVAGFVITIAMSWPSLQDLILDRLAEMDNPIYKAIIGDMGLEGLGLNFQAALFMYAGGTMNLIGLFVSIFVPVKLLSSEADEKSLDIVLSYPIPRWRYLLEKFGVYLTYNLLFPLFMVSSMIGTAVILGETYDAVLIINYAFGYWLLLFGLGSIALLCVTVFLDSNRSLAAAGAVIIGSYFLDSMGGLLGLSDLQFLSLFNHFKIPGILEAGMLPLVEVVIVVAVGFVFLISALYLFDKREISY